MKPGQGKSCPSCGERYEPGVLFCPLDGTPLTSARALSNPSLADADPYLGLELQGNIRLNSLVGVGSMGRVYRAFQAGIDRDVAVKVLHRELGRNRELVARFHREAKIASRLVHPNVVQVLMTGALEPNEALGIGGELYLVMEYLDGISLMSALAAASASDGDALPLARALHIVLQLSAAVGEAHAQGVVHRDLKPENIMLVRRGEDPDFVKVLDFGIARQDFAEPGSTQAGLIFGTAKYISPEGAEGQRVGPPADVYSIATIFYQCLAGRTPFDSDAPMTLLMQQSQTPAPDLRDVPRASYVPDPIADVIMANLSKDPSERASDGRELRKDLIAAARAAGLALESMMGQASLKIDSKQRTRAHDLGEDVSRALRAMTPEPRPSRPSLDGSEGRRSSAPPPRASRPSTPPSERTSRPPSEGSPPEDTIPGMSKVPGADVIARGPSHRVGPTMPGFPIDGEITERGERTAQDRDEPSPTIQGHAVRSRERSVDPISADVPASQPRRAAPSRLVVAAFGLLLAGGAFGVGRLSTPGPSADARAKDLLLQRGREAIENHDWDKPPKANVRDITDEALTRYPDDNRFRSLRQDAAARVLADALGRRYDGAPADALRLARLAAELDPSLSTAQKVADDLASVAENITPGAPPLPDDAHSSARAPGDSRAQRPAHAADPHPTPSASASASAAAPGARPSAGASAAVLPPPPPPLPDDLPMPPASGHPWL